MLGCFFRNGPHLVRTSQRVRRVVKRVALADPASEAVRKTALRNTQGSGTYPLVNIQKAIENGPRNSVCFFSIKRKWWIYV